MSFTVKMGDASKKVKQVKRTYFKRLGGLLSTVIPCCATALQKTTLQGLVCAETLEMQSRIESTSQFIPLSIQTEYLSKQTYNQKL